MLEFLMHFYGVDEETAAELLGELRDKRSLQKLADYRVSLSPPKKS